MVDLRRYRARGVFAGLAILAGLHVMNACVLTPLISLAGAGYLAVWFVGVTQLVYVLPAVWLARRRGRSAIAAGLIIGASITLLLNATCAGLVLLAR